MEYIRLATTLSEHRKWMATSGPACKVLIGLWVYCGRNETGGFVPAPAARREGLTARIAGHLEQLGWIHREQEGWLVHDWDDHQLSATEVKERREHLRRQWRERKRAQRGVKKEARPANVPRDGTVDVTPGTSRGNVTQVPLTGGGGGNPVETGPSGNCPTGFLCADESRAVLPLGGGPRSSALVNGDDPDQPKPEEPPGQPLSDDLVAALAPTNRVMAQLAERRRLAQLADAQRPELEPERTIDVGADP